MLNSRNQISHSERQSDLSMLLHRNGLSSAITLFFFPYSILNVTLRPRYFENRYSNN